MGSLQRTGDNILALSLNIVSGYYLADESLQSSEGSLVFFDFLGAFVIRWPEYMAKFVNIAGLGIGLYSIYLNMHSARRGKILNCCLQLNVVFLSTNILYSRN